MVLKLIQFDDVDACVDDEDDNNDKAVHSEKILEISR